MTDLEHMGYGTLTSLLLSPLHPSKVISAMSNNVTGDDSCIYNTVSIDVVTLAPYIAQSHDRNDQEVDVQNENIQSHKTRRNNHAGQIREFFVQSTVKQLESGNRVKYAVHWYS